MVVYEVAAPAPTGTCAQPATTAVPATVHPLTYEDGPHDAEGLAVDQAGVVHVVTKVYGGEVAGLYRAVDGTLRRVADLTLPTLGQAVTGAAFSPDGTTLVVRTYSAAHLFDTSDYGAEPTTAELPVQPQGESVTFTVDGRALVVTSEDPLRSRPPVWSVPLP